MNPDLEDRLTNVLADEARQVGRHGGSAATVAAAAKRRQTQRLAGGGLAALLLVVGIGSVIVSRPDNTPVELVLERPAETTVPTSVATSSDTSAPAETDTSPASIADPPSDTSETMDSADGSDDEVADIEVPDVEGLAEEDAINRLLELGLVADVRYLDLNPNDARIGFVTNQTPRPGTDVPESAEVTLAVGRSGEEALDDPATDDAPVEKVDIARLRGIDWTPWLRATSEISFVSEEDFGTSSYDYYDVYDRGGHALIDDVVYGDLNGDGAEDAIIPLDSGGTARGTGGLVYVATHEGPEFVADANFYNSFGYKAWPSIVDGEVVIDSVVGAGWEANCCYSGVASTTWRLVDGELVQTGYSERGVPEMRPHTIERFYALLDNFQYADAYTFLSPIQQGKEPFAEWKEGFDRTIEVTVDVGAERPGDRFDIDIVAADSVPTGGGRWTMYEGTWGVIWSDERHQWLLDAPSIREVPRRLTPSDDVTVVSDGSASFATPSGNISCVMGDGVLGASCHIAEKDWDIDEPANCDDGDYGNGVFVTEDGAEFGCYTDVWWDLEAETVSYGSTMTTGSFTCVIRADGVTCKNSTGGGFTLSRSAVDLFDGETLTTDGWSDVTIGMTADELVERGFGEPDTFEVFGDCGHVQHLTNSGAPTGMTWEGILVRLEAWKSHRDAEGLGIGSSHADVLAAYPSATVADHPYGGPDDDWTYIEVIDPDDPTRGTIFESDGSEIMSWRTGILENVRWIEGCA